MDQQYQALVHALLAIPFIERTEERIQAELNYQVWARHRMGELETNELDAMVEVSIKKAVAMPTDADVYVHFKEAVQLNLQANILNRKPTLLEVCQAADEEMKSFPNKGVKYEIVRTKIINEIECVDDICEGCGGVVEGSQWGGMYCSHYCWARSDND